jgi:hypothetical protein
MRKSARISEVPIKEELDLRECESRIDDLTFLIRYRRCKYAILKGIIAYVTVIDRILDSDRTVKASSVVTSQAYKRCSAKLLDALGIEVTATGEVDSMTEGGIDKFSVPEASVRIESVDLAILEVEVLAGVGIHNTPIS